MTELPGKFKLRMQQKLGDDYPAFEAALQTQPVISVRLNPDKPAGLLPDEEQVPWCADGKYLSERPAFVWDPLYHAGAYYAQDASSMIFANFIDFDKPLKALDLCAAPGGKSTLLLSLLSKDSLLVSNEMVGKRASILEENIIKWGASNSIITGNKPVDFLPFRGYFDVVLVDAPCSGEGMFRKDPDAARLWSEALVTQCSHIQKDIMEVAIQVVNDGGLLIYSTCTFEEAENEQTLQGLYEKYGSRISPVKLDPPAHWGLQKVSFPINGAEQEGYYCLPHKVKGEGMFLAAMRVHGNTSNLPSKGRKLLQPLSKKELSEIESLADTTRDDMGWYHFKDTVYALPKHLAEDAGLFAANVWVRKVGTIAGRLQRGVFIPDHDLVTSGLASPEVPRVEVNLEQALDYMQRKLFKLEADIPKGWIIFTYKGIDIGWAKNIGDRLNFHYPREWRIRKTPVFD